MSKGYTLIELIVVIALIVIITLIGFNSLRSGSSTQDVQNNYLDLRNDFQAQQESSLSNKIDSSTGSPNDYYGIKLLGTVSSGALRVTGFQQVKIGSCGNITQAQTIGTQINFPSGVSGTVTPVNFMWIFFHKDDGALSFYDSSMNPINPSSCGCLNADGSVSIQLTGSGVTKTIKIFPSTGRIE